VSHDSAIARIKGLSFLDIASLVECAADNQEARAFIIHVREGLISELDARNGQDLETQEFRDVLQELASGAPDAWNVTRILEAIGTGCHNVSSELTTSETTIVELAGYVLYEQARDIHAKLIELYNEELLVASEPTA
jgi:hypothetical protein